MRLFQCIAPVVSTPRASTQPHRPVVARPSPKTASLNPVIIAQPKPASRTQHEVVRLYQTSGPGHGTGTLLVVRQGAVYKVLAACLPRNVHFVDRWPANMSQQAYRKVNPSGLYRYEASVKVEFDVPVLVNKMGEEIRFGSRNLYMNAAGYFICEIATNTVTQPRFRMLSVEGEQITSWQDLTPAVRGVFDASGAISKEFNDFLAVRLTDMSANTVHTFERYLKHERKFLYGEEQPAPVKVAVARKLPVGPDYVWPGITFAPPQPTRQALRGCKSPAQRRTRDWHPIHNVNDLYDLVRHGRKHVAQKLAWNVCRTPEVEIDMEDPRAAVVHSRLRAQIHNPNRPWAKPR